MGTLKTNQLLEEKLRCLQYKLQLELVQAYMSEFDTLIEFARLGDFVPLKRFKTEVNRILNGGISEADAQLNLF